MIKPILVGLLMLVLLVPVQAQELVGARTQADRLFERYEYFKSLNLYLKLAENDNVSVAVLERIADCYRLINNYEQAEQWYATAIANKGTRPVDVYFYAEALQRNKKFDKAKEQYRQYFAKSGSKEQLDFKLGTCDSAMLWMKQPGGYKVNTEKKINSVYADWGVTYLDKTNLIFTSDRATADRNSSRDIYNRTGNEWLKLFNYDISTGSTTEMVMDNTGEINLSRDYHTGPIAINATGDTAYITVTTRLSSGKLPTDRNVADQQVYTRRLELMVATKKGDKWGNFTRFRYNNPTVYSVGHAALSKNGKLLYFTSDMQGGYGKTDIWYCERVADGGWGRPVNCGKTINTIDDEAFPTVGGDGKFYFASKGLPGMGGYDIYTAKGAGGIWNTPVNLKYPLNSTSDDFSLATIDGISGYISSDREGGQGSDDIYSFSYTGKEDQPVTAIAAKVPAVTIPPGMITLQGLVIDAKNNERLDSVTVLLKNTRGETIGGDLALSAVGFSFKVNPNQDYIIEVRKKGFYPVSQRITPGKTPQIVLTPLKLTMEPLDVGATFVLRNIYYDLNRANIRRDAMVELDKLVAIMKENPMLRIELSSHTDSRGSDYYNGLLSEARAVSAVAYIRRRGIAANRMVAKGYGETRLLNNCGNGVRCTEEQHQFNRRTEVKVLK